MKYPIQNRLARYLLHGTDRLLSRILSKQSPLPRPFRRILICNGAHLGDVVLTTSLIEPFQHLELGFLVGSWARPVIENHPAIDYIHTFDHWKLNRNPKNRLRNYWTTRRRALKELRAMKYDMAFDCSLHFPSSAPLLWQAGIPYRIGFESAGLFPFLTTSHPWAPSNRSVLESYAELVGKPITYSLPAPDLSPIQGDYIVVHIGSGAPEKKWSISHWRELAERLEKENLQLVFTGQGSAEKEAIASVSKHLAHAVDTSDALCWREFVALIASARLLISLDTAAAHIAAATQTPALQLFSGNNPPLLWKPNSLLCEQILLDQSSLDQIFRSAVDIYSPTL